MSGREAELRARLRDGDEETRYRATAAVDPDAPGARALLLDGLADPSWRVRSAAVDRIAAAADPTAALPALLELLVAGPGAGARDAAASALARIGAPAVALLVEALAAPSADLRQAAASVLGAIGDQRAAAPLTARLVDADQNVRTAAAEALGKLGGADATSALRAALDSDDALLRLAALDALAGVGACPPDLPVRALLADRTLRRPAYRLLGACDEPVALVLLAGGVAEPSRGARDAALGAVGRQRARRALQELAPLADALRAAATGSPALADGCAESLASDDPLVVQGALTALAWIGAPRHAGAVLALADDERFRAHVEDALDALSPDAELRGALATALPDLGPLARLTALAALARLGSPAALESVVREASDPESFVQADAIAALGRLADVRAVAPLAGLLGDDAPAVSSVAATALVRIAEASPAVRGAALAVLRDRAGASPSAALYRALGAVGDGADVDLARAGLRAPSVVQRMSAAGALATLARRGHLAGRSVPELVAGLSDPAWSVRAASARACAELSRASAARGEREPSAPREASPSLRAALRDPEPAVRAAAAEALGAAGEAGSVDAIAALLDDPRAPPLVAVAALRALACIGAPPRAAVERAAAHTDPEVVKEAVLAAARLPGEDGARLLRAAAESARWDVRRAAARAMAERRDPALAADAARLAARDPDPLVARAFADAAQALRGG